MLLLQILVHFQKKSNSQITTNAISYDKVTPPTQPFDQVLDDTLFFDNAAEWKKQKGYNWNNPDHLMVFTM